MGVTYETETGQSEGELHIPTLDDRISDVNSCSTDDDAATHQRLMAYYITAPRKACMKKHKKVTYFLNKKINASLQIEIRRRNRVQCQKIKV